MLPAPYSAVIVTFRRPATLRMVLDGLAAQAHRPTVVIVADNDPERSAERVVDDVRRTGDLHVDYVPVGRNAGPAGGWAAAVARAGALAERGEWVAVLDDDDPVEHPDVMARLAATAAAAGDDVAAVGLRGAVLRRHLATLDRIDRTGAGGSADYLASNGAPLYRWSAVDRAGFFDADLFFGFEDLDLGLRLRGRGLRLLVEPLPSLHAVHDTSASRSPWREYYKTRSLVTICRRHLGLIAVVATVARAVLAGSLVLLVRHRDVSLVAARWRGAWHGVRGRLGPGPFVPAANPPKSAARDSVE